jgi:hypothetical protein
MAVRSRSVVSVLMLVGCGWVVACGGSSPASNSGTPTPVAVNTATPVPTPTPSPFPGEAGCNLPPSGPGLCQERTGNNGVFVEQVDDTVLAVQAAHPDYFHSDGTLMDFGRFRVAVIAGLEARGLCAVVDGEEIAIKNDNSFSEQWHVEQSNGRLRIGPFAYRATCHPANFPVNPTAIPPRTDCSLPSSFAYACSRLDTPQFLDLVEATEDAVIAAHPELTDGQTVAQENWKPFYQAMIDDLRGKGYCAIFDGEELAIKNTNDFNEQYHPVLSSTTLRRGPGQYRSTCSPAAF